jgi:hypothetical protein
MTMPPIPDDPFALVEQPPFELAGRSQRDVFGAPVEVLSIPRRAGRQGIPGAGRPTFQHNRADQIIAAEAVWRAPGMALTGNRFPFCEQQALLWSTERRREPTLEMLEVSFRMEDAVAGTSIVNSIGASGSVTRSHIHLTGGTSAFLAALPKSELDPAAVHLTPDQLRGCELLRLAPPFPVIAVGVRGPAAARALAFHHLLECRTPQAFNLISCDQIAWLFPRSSQEVPAPFFPQALGGAELAGRWCCHDRAVFARLSTADMEDAIRLAGIAWPETS